MSARQVASRWASGASFAGGLGALLAPKCALCVAAYASALGALGLGPVVHQRLVEPLLAAAVVGSFGLVLALGAHRRDLVTPLVSAAGAVLVLAGRFALAQAAVTGAGAVLLVTAALVNGARCRSKLGGSGLRLGTASPAAPAATGCFRE